VKNVFDAMESVKRRNATGGTGPQSVKKQIQMAKSTLTPDPFPSKGEGRTSKGEK
jgi:argininosuccinate lyase